MYESLNDEQLKYLMIYNNIKNNPQLKDLSMQIERLDINDFL